MIVSKGTSLKIALTWLLHNKEEMDDLKKRVKFLNDTEGTENEEERDGKEARKEKIDLSKGWETKGAKREEDKKDR